jgi:hypothetical protein
VPVAPAERGPSESDVHRPSGHSASAPYELYLESVFGQVGEPVFTNFTDRFVGTLDYVLVTPHLLTPLCALSPLADAVVRMATALPNPICSSDHISIVADLHWRAEPRGVHLEPRACPMSWRCRNPTCPFSHPELCIRAADCPNQARPIGTPGPLGSPQKLAVVPSVAAPPPSSSSSSSSSTSSSSSSSSTSSRTASPLPPPVSSVPCALTHVHPCKFGITCEVEGCQCSHLPCRRGLCGAQCKVRGCPYAHVVPCRFGFNCKRQECHYHHPYVRVKGKVVPEISGEAAVAIVAAALEAETAAAALTAATTRAVARGSLRRNTSLSGGGMLAPASAPVSPSPSAHRQLARG